MNIASNCSENIIGCILLLHDIIMKTIQKKSYYTFFFVLGIFSNLIISKSSISSSESL